MDNLKITHLVLGGENLSAKLVCQLLEKVNKHSWAKIIAFYQLKFVKNSTTAGQPRKRRNNSSQCSDKARESMHMTSLKPRSYTKQRLGTHADVAYVILESRTLFVSKFCLVLDNYKKK